MVRAKHHCLSYDHIGWLKPNEMKESRTVYSGGKFERTYLSHDPESIVSELLKDKFLKAYKKCRVFIRS